jgi:hypothetical protein
VTKIRGETRTKGNIIATAYKDIENTMN